MDYGKTKPAQRSKTEEFYFVDPEDGECKVTIKNARKKLEISYGSRNALQDGDKKASYGKLLRVETLTHTRKRSILDEWKLTNPQGNVWNLLFREIMTFTSRRKVPTH